MASQYNIDYDVVKKPGKDEPLTDDQVKKWLEYRNDPMKFFTEVCYVVGPKGKTLFEPRQYQVELLQTILEETHTIINAPRQVGKSTLLTLLGVHSAIFNKDATIGMTSYRQSGCKDLLQRVKYTYENLPNWLKVPVTLYNQSEIRFTNGSNIFVQVTSSQIFRGKSFGEGSLAIFDEFAHVDYETAEGAYEAAMPALEGGGSESRSKAVIISTPNGTGSNKYAQLAFGAMDGVNGWKYHKVDPSTIQGRDEAWRKKTIASYGMTKFRQEFLGEFLSSKPILISSPVLESIKTSDPVNEINGLRLYVTDLSNRTLVVGVDVSEGVGLDSSTFQVIDIDTMEQVAEFDNNEMNQNDFTKMLLNSLRYFDSCGCGDIYLGVEKNGVGQGVLRLLENTEDPIMDRVIHLSDVDENGNSKNRSGLSTTSRTKLDACGMLKDLVEERKLKLYSIKLLNQLRVFSKVGNTFKAEKGLHDDLVSSMLIVMMMLKQVAFYEDRVHEVINNIEDVESETWGISF